MIALRRRRLVIGRTGDVRVYRACVCGYSCRMSDQSANTQGTGSTSTPNEDAGVARDVLDALNVKGVVDEPGRPAEMNPQESLPTDADVPPPG